MPGNEPPADGIDWGLTTWEGARREQLRRWAALPLERIILAIEEMQDLSEQLRHSPATGNPSGPVADKNHAARETPPFCEPGRKA